MGKKTSRQNADLNKKSKKKRKKYPAASPYQIDNLLRFLNDVLVPEDILNTLNLSNTAQNKKIAKAIVNYKVEHGPYLELRHLQRVPSLNSKSLQYLLDNSRYLIVSSTPFSLVNTDFTLGFLDFGIRIFFKFRELPQGWTAIGDLLILWDFKTAKLESEKTEADNQLRRARRSLRNATTGGAPQSVIQDARARVNRAQQKVDRIKRETDELNKKVDERDLKGFWKIIKANIEEHIEKLRHRETGLERARESEDDADELEHINQQLTEIRDEIRDYQNSVNSTENAINPPPPNSPTGGGQ